MKKEQFLKKMLYRYKKWLKDPISKEEAAFEYLKRNPYFILTVLHYKKHFQDYPNYKTDDKHLYNVMLIKDHMYRILSKVFLYTGSDIANKYSLYVKDNTNDSNLANYLSFDSSATKDEEYHYSYSSIYDPYPIERDAGKLYEESNRVKKEYSVNSAKLLGDIEDERWLSHLLPSLYLKINPFYSSNRLKSDLSKVISVISKNEVIESDEKVEGWMKYAQYAIPEILINEDRKDFKSFDSPSFTTLSSAISLMVYDLQKIFKLNAQELETLLKEEFTESEYNQYKLDKYFTSSGASDGYSGTVFEKEFNTTRRKEVVKRINGGYLNYIYPPESIQAHFDLVQKEGLVGREHNFEGILGDELTDAQNKFWQEFKEYNKSGDYISDIFSLGIVSVQDFSTDEYKDLSEAVFSIVEKADKNELTCSILLL